MFDIDYQDMVNFSDRAQNLTPSILWSVSYKRWVVKDNSYLLLWFSVANSFPGIASSHSKMNPVV